MKKLLLIFVIMSAVITLFAQSPGKLSYQAVIRNSQDKLVTNHAIGMRITILKGSASGTAVYHETHNASTNANGLLTLEIGSGITSEDFSALDWSKGPYFIKTETDPEGGTNYTITGTSQLLSVPYALYAQTAGNFTGTINETDPVFKASQAARITSGDIAKLGNLSGVNTGDQDISAMTHSNRIALDAVTGTNTGDQDLSGLATSTALTTGLNAKVDKVVGKGLSTEDYTTAEKAKVANLSGVNTGDQDISAMMHNNRSFLNAVTGINTGDQDLSGLASSTALTTGLNAKVDKVAGKGLSTNDYTTAEQTKLAGIAAGAEVNVQADWTQTTNTADDFIKNKPAIPSQYTDAMADIRVAAGITNKVDKVAGKGLSTEDYTTPEKTKLAAITGTNTGDQDLSGLATTTSVTTGLATKVDKVAGKGLSTEDYTTAEKTKVSNISGVNTGDQDISAMTHTNRIALDAVSGINTGDQDLSGLATTTSVTTGLAAKVDKVAGKGLSTEDYTTPEKTKLAAITGTNTGDQDLSGLATTTAVTTGLATKVDKVAGKGLSTNDYTTAEQTKLAGIAAGAEVNIQADWNQTTNIADDFIRNKPVIPSQYTDAMADVRVAAGITNKVDKVAGKGLSTEDYTTPEKAKLAAITGTNTGDQDLSALATTAAVTTGLAAKVDKIAGKGLSTEDYTTVEKTKVSNLSGVNTGDQDISAMTHTNRTALDAVTGTNTGDQDLSGLATTTAVTTGLATKVDKVAGKGLSTEDYTTVEKTKVSNLSGVNTGDQDISAMTHTNRPALDAVSGINTGDQDLSGLATTTSVTTGLATKVDKVAGKGLSTEDYTYAEKSKVSNLSGVNTGDQDISAMTHTNRTALDAVTGINTGDQDLSGLATTTSVTTGLSTKVDKVAGKGLSTEDYTTAEKTKVSNISGVNTGDQDISAMTHTNRIALDAVSGINTGDQDLSGLATTTSVTTGLAAKVDKVAGKGLSTEDYTTAEKTKVSNLSGVNTGDQDISAMTHTNRIALDAVLGINTGDQDLSGLATTTSVTTGLATKVDKIAGKGLSTEDYTTPEKTKLAAITGTNTGDQDLSGLATTAAVTSGLATKVDKVAGKGLSTEDYTTAEKTKVSNLSGINTGDQDISAMTHANRTALDAVAGINTGDQDISAMTHTNRTALDAVSGINTGDQDLSGLATKTEVTTGLAAKVDKITGKGLSTEDYTTAEKTKVSNLSGVNSGDQDISAMIHANRTALDAVSGINTGDQDLSGLATTTSVTTGLATKVDKVAGKGLSTNDYTTVEQTKLAGIAAGAEVNVQADWNQTTNTADDFIRNKPVIPSQYTDAMADVRVAAGITNKVDKVAGKGLSTEDYTTPEKAKLAAITGTNTGDQDLSGLATKTEVTTGLAAKVDKVAGKGLSTEDYTTAEKAKVSNLSGVNTGDQDISAMTHTNRTALDAVTGINTGDQDLIGLATKTEVTTGLATKVDKVAGKGLSTNDYTTAEQTKLAGIAAGAEVNVQADWNQTTNTADDYIKNKPTIPSQYTDAMADVRVAAGITNKVDKVAGKGLSTEDYTTAEKTKVSNLSGVNTGDQNISAMTHTNRTALDAVSGTNTGDQDLSGLATKTEVTTGLAAKVDKVAGKGLSTEDYTTAEKAKVSNLSGVNTGDQDISAMTHTNRTALDAVTGINTGDQDLSGLATTTSVTTGLATKVDKVAGKGLSTNDYTTVEQTKLAGIAAGAEVNVQADWNQTTTTADDFIKNKPAIPSQYTDAMADVRVAAGITNKVDKVAGKGLSTEDYTTAEKTKVSNLSGVNTGDQDIAAMTHANRTALDAVSGINTGDQDLSGLATKTALRDSTAKVRSQIPDVSHFLTNETDPVFSASPAKGITSANITNWNAAFGWGDHAGLYRPAGWVPGWNDIAGKPFRFDTPKNGDLLWYDNGTGRWINWTPDFLTNETDPIVKAISGMVKSNGSAISAAVSGTDYLAPGQAVTAVSGSAPIVSSGGTTPAISINPATTSAAGSMSAADKVKLDGIATGATNYVHPTGDGYLHVPATGITNEGKVLTAGPAAGSLSWGDISLKNFSDISYTYDSKAGVKLFPANAATDVDVVISPKGNGSFLLHQPDGTTAGGNKRGNGAVELQTYSDIADQVASGDYAILAGGASNKATGENSAVVGGGGSTISLSFGQFAIRGNTASGTSSFIGGGMHNNAAGTYSFIAGGASNTAYGTGSLASGLSNSAKSYGETVLGINSTVVEGNPDNFVSTDRLLNVGNGIVNFRSDAFTILKNANTTVGGSLTINNNGGNTSITFPTGRGSSGQLLQTDGIGGTSWANPTAGTVMGVTGSAPIVSSGGNTPVISISTATPTAAGSMSAADKAKLDGFQAGWNLTGNSGTDPATNFIGTTDDKALVFKVFGNKAGEVSSGFNTSFGYQALNSNTTGYNNTANGYRSLFNNTTGDNNTAIGSDALHFNTTGDNNTAMGEQALVQNTTGGSNIAIGHFALYNNIANSRSTALGYQALANADNRTTGQETFNTAVGYQALAGSTMAVDNTGQYNTAVGDQALVSNSSGGYNTAFGVQSLYSNTSGNYNLANGQEALSSNTTGNYNSAIGFQAGKYITGGAVANASSSNSVYLGAQTEAFANAQTNEIVIGYDATGAGSNTVTLGNTAITTTVLRGIVRHYGATSGYVGLRAPSTATSYTLTLPNAAPASNGQVLSTTTAGVMSWVTPASGTVTGVTGTTPIVSSGGSTPAISISAATTSAAGSMSAADKTKLDGIAANANNYTHPTGDGNLHVPATGTTNSGKVLTAGATAGSLSWTSLPVSAVTSVEGRTGAVDVTKADVGLSLVENTALSTWTGSSNLTTTGTITAGNWNGSIIPVAYGGTGAASKAAAFDALSPMTTQGDIIYGGADGTGTQLAKGGGGQFLKMNADSTAPEWSSQSLLYFDESTYHNTDFYGRHVSILKAKSYGGKTSFTDVMISPSSSGAIYTTLPYVPRGRRAVDFQRNFDDTTQVAQGTSSALLGGVSNTARGDLSAVVGGWHNISSGVYSFMGGGLYNRAGSYAETVFGTYATDIAGDTANFVSTDRLFVLGNGTSESTRSNALSILKNGNTTIGGTLQINKNGTNTSYVFPDNRGTSAQVLYTNGDGTTGWKTLTTTQVNSDWNAASGVAQILNKPTTVAGYGLTDVVTLTGNQTIAGIKTFNSNLVVSGVSVGKGAGSASFNTALGYGVLPSNTLGDENVAIGHKAMYSNLTGNENIAIGSSALYSNRSNFNVATGNAALYQNTTGEGNTALGYASLAAIVTGKYNTAIGYQSDVSTGGLTNATAIGANTEVNASNKVRIGNTSVTVIEGQVAFTAASDIRLKENIADLHTGLDFILKLRPVEYRLKKGDGRTNFGFIAQDIEKLLGEQNSILTIGGDKERTLGLRYTDFIAPMVKAIQEQQAQISDQQKQIESYQSENENLKSRLQKLEEKIGQIESRLK